MLHVASHTVPGAILLPAGAGQMYLQDVMAALLTQARVWGNVHLCRIPEQWLHMGVVQESLTSAIWAGSLSEFGNGLKCNMCTSQNCCFTEVMTKLNELGKFGNHHAQVWSIL